MAGYSESSFRTPEPTNLEDETTVIVPRTGPHTSPRPLPRKHTPEGVPLRMQGSSVVDMVPRKRLNDTPAPLPPRKTPPPLLSSMAVAAAHVKPSPPRVPREKAPARRATPVVAPTPARSATPAPAPRSTGRADRRWSSRTLAILGAGMGTGTAMVLGVGLLGMVAVLAPPSNNVVTNPAASSMSAPGWVDVVVAVGTTLVTGERAVDRPMAGVDRPPVAALAAAPAATRPSLMVAPTRGSASAASAPSAPDAKEERVLASVAPTRAPSVSKPAASAKRVPSKKAGAAPSARTARAVPASLPAAPIAPAVVPAGTVGAEPGGSADLAVASAEIDPWASPTVAPEPEGISAGEVEVWSPQAEVVAPAVAAARPAAPVEEVDLLAGDDGLGEATEWTLERATLIDVGGTAASNEEALADVESLDTRVVRISVAGGPARVSVDGRSVGSAPAIVEVAPGVHRITLSVEDKDTTFELQARTDPDAWCFEARGKSFGAVTCGL